MKAFQCYEIAIAKTR